MIVISNPERIPAILPDTVSQHYQLDCTSLGNPNIGSTGMHNTLPRTFASSRLSPGSQPPLIDHGQSDPLCHKHSRRSSSHTDLPINQSNPPRDAEDHLNYEPSRCSVTDELPTSPASSLANVTQRPCETTYLPAAYDSQFMYQNCSLAEGRVPKGSWGWLVILGSFLCLFVVEGLSFSYGLYLYEMIVERQFSVASNQSEPSLAALTLPGALLCGLCMLIGPLSGALVNCFSYRSVAGLGAIVATVCTQLSVLSQNLSWFTVLFGLFGGIGCGLIYLPAITVVGHWFEHRRAVVVGLAMCGGGLGAGVLAVVVSPLCRTVAWRGSIILTGALFFQSLLGIAFFRPLYTHELICLLQSQRRGESLPKHKQNSNSKKKPLKIPKRSQPTTRVQHGSIMARIIEEKSRQRTTSTGSLDGMVITRENELVALPSPEAQEAVMAAVTAYQVQQQQKRQHLPHLLHQSDSPSSAVCTTAALTAVDRPSSCTYTTALQTLQEDVSLSPKEGKDKVQTPHFAVLPPPVQFSRAAIRRIACAILWKVHAGPSLPYTSSSGGLSLCSHFRPSYAGHHVDSWGTSEACRYRRTTGGREHLSHSPVDKLDRRDSSRKISLNISYSHKESCVLPDFKPHSDFTTSRELPVFLEGRSGRTNDGSTSVPIQTPQCPSCRASMASLDSKVDRQIIRELHSLPLDEATKGSVVAALRAELSRPKCRTDLFHLGGRKVSPADQTSCAGALDLKETGRWFGSSVTPQSTDPPGPGGDHYSISRRAPPTAPIREVYTKFTDHSPCWVQEQPRGVTGQHKPNDRVIPQETRSYWPEMWVYLRVMLHPGLLSSPTFLVLLVACSLNMLVLLIPYHYLPLLLHFGGIECSHNTLWCPDGLPHETTLQPDWLNTLMRWLASDVSSAFFVSPGSVLLTIGIANVLGRMIAALYIEQSVNTGCRLFRLYPSLSDPMVLNNIALLLCTASLSCFPLCIHGVITKLPTVGHASSGASQYVQAWSMEFRVVLVYLAAVAYGVASAVSLSLRSVTLVELFGIQRLTNAFGHLLIFQGLAVICGPPLFGYFCDTACHGLGRLCGDYVVNSPLEGSAQVTACATRLNQVFYACAALFFLTTLLFAPLRWLARHEANFCRSCISLRTRPSAPISSDGKMPDSAVTDTSNPIRRRYDPQETQTTQILPEVLENVES